MQHDTTLFSRRSQPILSAIQGNAALLQCDHGSVTSHAYIIHAIGHLAAAVAEYVISEETFVA